MAPLYTPGSAPSREIQADLAAALCAGDLEAAQELIGQGAIVDLCYEGEDDPIRDGLYGQSPEKVFLWLLTQEVDWPEAFMRVPHMFSALREGGHENARAAVWAKLEAQEERV